MDEFFVDNSPVYFRYSVNPIRLVESVNCLNNFIYTTENLKHNASISGAVMGVVMGVASKRVPTAQHPPFGF